MLLTRGTFYWLWFIVFGVIAILIAFNQSHPLSSENWWLLFASAGGIVTDTKSTSGYWSRPYDMFIGVFFFTAGSIGIMHNFGLNLINNTSFLSWNIVNSNNFLGLCLDLGPSLLHAVLGFLALKFALRNPVTVSSLEVDTTEKK
jgi:hypothetical protein